MFSAGDPRFTVCGPNILLADLRRARNRLKFENRFFDEEDTQDPLNQVWSLGWQAPPHVCSYAPGETTCQEEWRHPAGRVTRYGSTST